MQSRTQRFFRTKTLCEISPSKVPLPFEGPPPAAVCLIFQKPRQFRVWLRRHTLVPRKARLVLEPVTHCCETPNPENPSSLAATNRDATSARIRRSRPRHNLHIDRSNP